jgi:hypothetical protein
MKVIGECGREIVENVCPISKARHEKQDWAIAAPIEYLEVRPVHLDEPLHMWRAVNGHAVCASRDLRDDLPGAERKCQRSDDRSSA